MLSLLMMLSLAPLAPTSPATPAASSPAILHCTAANTAAGKNRKCHVKLPAGAQLAPCAAADRAAGHCSLDARYVAWVVPAGGAQCKVNRKKTDWRTTVGVKVGKKTRPGVGRCDLHVALR